MQRKISPFVPVGLLALVVGILLRNFTHTNYSEFAAGLLIGMSIVFLIFGVVQKARAATR
jgi:hypothetical protein